MDWVKLSVFLFLCVIFSAGCSDFSPNVSISSTPTPTITPSLAESLEERNVQISEEIVKQYHETHAKNGSEMLECGDMACDVWEVLEDEGIHAKIMIGRLDREVANLSEADHAWVVAEVSPNTWLALDPTEGQSATNPLYYSGWHFATPTDFRRYEQLLTQFNDQSSKYGTERLKYQRMVEEYNSAGILVKIEMNDEVQTQKAIVEQQQGYMSDTLEEMLLLVNSYW